MRIEEPTATFVNIDVIKENELYTIRYTINNVGMAGGTFEISVYDDTILLGSSYTRVVEGSNTFSGVLTDMRPPESNYFYITAKSLDTMKTTCSRSVFVGNFKGDEFGV